MPVVALSVWSILSANSAIQAGPIVFDTAANPAGPVVLILGDWNWPFHRFELSSPTTLETVGGYFANFTGEAKDVFAAVVQLSGPADNPDSLDLSTSDVLGTTLISVGTVNGAYASPLPLTLSSGWYALEFGTGKFGASSAQSLVHLSMPGHSVDLDPTQLVQVAIQSGHPISPPQFTASSLHVRFFATIPEPATLTLVALGGLLAMRRRR